MSASLLMFLSTAFICFLPILMTARAENGVKKFSIYTTLFLVLWSIMTYFVGKSGLLNDFSSMPPKPLFMLLTVFIVALLLAISKHGTLLVQKLSIYTLIGFQSFRFLPEFFLDLSYREGLAPIQMTYYGRNFDIVVAIIAVIIVLLKNKIRISDKSLAIGFSFLGLGLLFNILVVAVLSMPLPFRIFMNEPANTFVVRAPYIWLPTIHVFLALWCHFLLIRKVRFLK